MTVLDIDVGAAAADGVVVRIVAEVPRAAADQVAAAADVAVMAKKMGAWNSEGVVAGIQLAPNFGWDADAEMQRFERVIGD